MSAKNKLLLSIGSLIVLIVAILSVLSYNQINESSTSDYRNRLSTESFLISKAIEGKVNNYFTALEAISNSLVVEQGNVVIDDRVIKSLIENKNEMGILNFFVSLSDGAFYDADNEGMHSSFNAKEMKREWFIKGMSGSARTVTTPFMATTGDLTMVMAIPFKQNNRVIAVIGLSLKVSDITDYIREISPSKNIFVSRDDGFLMAAPKTDLVGDNLFKFRPSYEQYAVRNNSEHSYTLNDGNDYYVVSSKITSLDWIVWSGIDWNEINATSYIAVKTNIVSGLIFIVFGSLGVSLLITKLMYLPIGGEPKDIETLVNNIASGNLTGIPEPDLGSVGVYRSTLIMANNLKKMIIDINNASQQLLQVSGQLGDTSEKVDASSKSQMMQLEQIATAMNEMTATVNDVAQNAVETSQSSNKANISSKHGLHIVNQMNDDITLLVGNISRVQDVIGNVHRETENVGGILDVIRGIADQTNLLALNAAIEAARAGEHGRGFAVVADEVRTLATKTQNSTNEIHLMLVSLQEQATSSVTLMMENATNAQETLTKSNNANQALVLIEKEIQVIQDMNDQIATAAEQQSHVASEINENIVKVNDLARDTVDDVQDNACTAKELNTMALSLSKSMSMFKI